MDLMIERWYGIRARGRLMKLNKLWWLFLNIWCLFDVVFFPLSFLVAFVKGNVKLQFIFLASLNARKTFNMLAK